MDTTKHPIKIAILAMGGQGGGVLSDWIVKLAEGANYLTQATSVPGVAQRTGATVYYIELLPQEQVEKQGQKPVMALMPVKGDVDLVIAGELVEAGRALMRGFISKDKTIVIASNHRDYAVTEKIEPGDGRVDKTKIKQRIVENAKHSVCFDMAGLAEETNSVISAILFGAVAGSKALPFVREDYEELIRSQGVAVEANLKGFESGYKHSAQRSIPDSDSLQESEPETVSSPNPHIQKLLDQIYRDCPEPSHKIIIEAIRKLVDYQDIAYAQQYLDKMKRILVLDRDGKDKNHALISEMGRYLALWMSYEDTIRVADLKIRKERFQRIRKEVHASASQYVNLKEFMHPRVEEICDTMPAWLGNLVLNSPLLSSFVALFCRKGRCIATSSISGYLLLYSIACLRRWRRISYRYQREMRNIDDWFARVEKLSQNHYELAVEIARCQRLIKGYGETHERGTKNFNRIMNLIANVQSRENAAVLVKEMRLAALADEKGGKLEEVMRQVA